MQIKKAILELLGRIGSVRALKKNKENKLHHKSNENTGKNNQEQLYQNSGNSPKIYSNQKVFIQGR